VLELKLVISFFIVIATSYIGFLKATKVRDREYILREMVTFLGFVENEIKYMMSILPNAYESARQKLNTDLKSAIGKIVVDMLYLENTELVNQSIVENISKIQGLSEYDKNVFISTLKNLGSSDIDGQMNIIENAKSIIENQIIEASEYKLKNSKMYKTMGVITGIMLVIIFI
jgi:stage III sporulation protein AB